MTAEHGIAFEIVQDSLQDQGMTRLVHCPACATAMASVQRLGIRAFSLFLDGPGHGNTAGRRG
ncbi:MAG: hypothetical protein TQ37_00200 [Candidatus Synechococcus spongiarum 15L]|uniref:Uncharacterized protein n=1 Tax=Candidatus Synechococcus spongiarum 15L TaxID=1608419 RepID=A0A0G8AZA4_9SYNE|nr:MAG: hypothetical protein TQ37_00200 [Candidatus Synechococcus spongiarum 15L]